MTATDELRRMLDERGVEWGNIRNDGSESDYLTEWQFDGIEGHAIATEWAVGQHLTVCIAHPMTPEQAVTATLGSCNCSNDCTNDERTGTCHADETGRFSFHVWNGGPVTVHVMECSECGRTYEHVNGDYEFCPRCGRRIVEVNA